MLVCYVLVHSCLYTPECRYHDEETQEYEKLMRDVLKNGTVDEKGRARLRDHRYEHSVDSNHHLRVLRKLGWSMDDFEEGKRGLHPPVVQHTSSPKALQRMSTFVTQVLATVENDSADDDDTNEADTDIGGGSC